MINPIMKLAAIALTATAVAASTAVAQVKLHQPVVRSGKIRRGVDERAEGGARKGRHGQYFRVMRPQALDQGIRASFSVASIFGQRITNQAIA
jgi:hypothetical protein